MKEEFVKCFVYRLRSKRTPSKTYVGITCDLHKRLREHNEGLSQYTSKDGPWYIETAVWFRDEQKAKAFERYLKSGSGRAFAAKRF